MAPTDTIAGQPSLAEMGGLAQVIPFVPHLKAPEELKDLPRPRKQSTTSSQTTMSDVERFLLYHVSPDVTSPENPKTVNTYYGLHPTLDEVTYKFLPKEQWLPESFIPDTSFVMGKGSKPFPEGMPVDFPYYAGGMSIGAMSPLFILAFAKAAGELGIEFHTGEGGISDEIMDLAKIVAVQYASGQFGVGGPYFFGYTGEKRKIYNDLVSGKISPTDLDPDTLDDILYGRPKVRKVQIKLGQGAKAAKGGKMPKKANHPSVAMRRHVGPNIDLNSPNHFDEITSVEDLRTLTEAIREKYGGDVWIDVKLSGNNLGWDVEQIGKAIQYGTISVDFQGAGTGSANEEDMANGQPNIFGLRKAYEAVNRLRKRGYKHLYLAVGGGFGTREFDLQTALAYADFVFMGNKIMEALGCTDCPISCASKSCADGPTSIDPDTMKKYKEKLPYLVERVKAYFLLEQDKLRKVMRALGKKTLYDENGNKTITPEDLIALTPEAADASGLQFAGKGETVTSSVVENFSYRHHASTAKNLATTQTNEIPVNDIHSYNGYTVKRGWAEPDVKTRLRKMYGRAAAVKVKPALPGFDGNLNLSNIPLEERCINTDEFSRGSVTYTERPNNETDPVNINVPFVSYNGRDAPKDYEAVKLNLAPIMLGPVTHTVDDQFDKTITKIAKKFNLAYRSGHLTNVEKDSGHQIMLMDPKMGQTDFQERYDSASVIEVLYDGTQDPLQLFIDQQRQMAQAKGQKKIFAVRIEVGKLSQEDIWRYVRDAAISLRGEGYIHLHADSEVDYGKGCMNENASVTPIRTLKTARKAIKSARAQYFREYDEMPGNVKLVVSGGIGYRLAEVSKLICAGADSVVLDDVLGYLYQEALRKEKDPEKAYETVVAKVQEELLSIENTLRIHGVNNLFSTSGRKTIVPEQLRAYTRRAADLIGARYLGTGP
ncbi:hypothetical protein J4206_00545 [Candidatus Woesearchaeota archaeon]|nr:hypothetical protein [Candidatus Woesearchaeota archaeon]